VAAKNILVIGIVAVVAVVVILTILLFFGPVTGTEGP
jgi:uncharacterized membrane protein